MKNILKLEQLALLIGILFIYHQIEFSWLWFTILFFAPDIFMLGYIFGNKIGAITYNFIHNYTVTLTIVAIGYFTKNETLLMIGLIFTAHNAFDRFLGYGLKKYSGFKSTHLGDL